MYSYHTKFTRYSKVRNQASRMKIAIFIVSIILPAMAVIDVDLTAAKNPRRAAVHATGMNVEGLTYAERGSFGIQDNAIKKLIDNYFGRRPEHAFFDKPGGEHPTDLYDKYGWTPVTRTLYSLSAKINKLKTEPTIVARQKFSNNSKRAAIYNAAISQEIANEISTTWSTSKDITVGQMINYGVEIGVASLGGSTHYEFTSSWGQEETKSETVTVGTTSAVILTLEPKEKCIAELSATRGTMEVLVEYEAFLHGEVALVYNPSYKGFRYHHLDINDILYHNGLPEEIRRNETVKIGFYADAFVDISDDDMTLAEEDCFIEDNHGGGPYGEDYLNKSNASSTIRPPVRRPAARG